MIELRLVRDALTLARFRNFARAAEALNTTQPTLSRNIAALERSLGVRLFDRTRMGVETTAFGRLLLERGAALLGGEAELRREIELLAGLEVGTLVIGAAPFPAEISVAPAIARLIASRPGLHVELITANPQDIPTAVREGRFHLGLADLRLLDEDQRLHIEPLPRHPIFIAVRPGHPLLGRRDLKAEDVFRFPVAATHVLGLIGTAMAATGAAGASDPRTGDFTPPVTVDSLSLARQIALASDALAPYTPAVSTDESATRGLVPLDFHLPWMQTNYGFMHLRGRTLSPAAQAFMSLVREVEAEVARGGTVPPSRQTRSRSRK